MTHDELTVRGRLRSAQALPPAVLIDPDRMVAELALILKDESRRALGSTAR